MKTIYGTILVLAMVVVLLTAAPPCGAVEKEEKSIWSEDKPGHGHKRFELTDEKIEHIMSRLKETNAEKAEELEKLREEDLEKFKAELRETMRERFEKRFKEHRKERTGPHHGGRPGGGGDMPHMPGMHGGMQPGMGMHWRHAEFLEWLRENYPEEAEKLAGLKEKKPKLHTRRIALTLKKYRRIFEAEKENPKLAEALKEDLVLKEQRDKLLRKIRAASDDKRGKLVERLEEVVSSRFDLIVKRKQIEYEQLRKKLRKLREQVKQSEAEVQKWKDVKDKEIKQRLEELISRTEEFKWD